MTKYKNCLKKMKRLYIDIKKFGKIFGSFYQLLLLFERKILKIVKI